MALADANADQVGQARLTTAPANRWIIRRSLPLKVRRAADHGDVGQAAELEPGEEFPHGDTISGAGIRVADIDGETSRATAWSRLYLRSTTWPYRSVMELPDGARKIVTRRASGVSDATELIKVRGIW
jgi:hypothetical protein